MQLLYVINLSPSSFDQVGIASYRHPMIRDQSNAVFTVYVITVVQTVVFKRHFGVLKMKKAWISFFFSVFLLLYGFVFEVVQ